MRLQLIADINESWRYESRRHILFIVCEYSGANRVISLVKYNNIALYSDIFDEYTYC
jgi:hypothetical protein